MALLEECTVRTVVCYGDSNTFGAEGNLAKLGQRMPYPDRWTTHLQRNLGSSVMVIPEGLNGRTTVLDDPHTWHCHGTTEIGTGANGRRYMLPMLNSHRPIDVVVLALGCNDLKTRFGLGPSQIAWGCKLLIQDIRASGCGPDGAAPK